MNCIVKISNSEAREIKNETDEKRQQFLMRAACVRNDKNSVLQNTASFMLLFDVVTRNYFLIED